MDMPTTASLNVGDSYPPHSIYRYPSASTVSGMAMIPISEEISTTVIGLSVITNDVMARLASMTVVL